MRQGWHGSLQLHHCDLFTGVTGRTCNVCKPGYWKYSEIGCQSCNCAEKFSEGTGCDQNTGQCKCLPGVIGEKCDSCPWRWVFIKNERCLECGSCVHSLLDDTDKLPAMIDPVLEELQVVSSSVFAIRRLVKVNETIDEFRKRIDNLIQQPSNVDLSNVLANLLVVEAQADKAQYSAESSMRQGEKNAMKAIETIREASEVLKAINNATEELRIVINELKRLETTVVHTQAAQDLENKLREAERVYQQMNGTDISAHITQGEEEKSSAEMLVKKVEDFKSPAIESQSNITATRELLERVNNILIAFKKHIQTSIETTLKAENIHQEALKIQEMINPNLKQMPEDKKVANEKLQEARKLIDEAKSLLTSVPTKIVDLSILAEKLKAKSSELEKRKNIVPEENEELQRVVILAIEHSKRLEAKAKDLQNIAESSRNSSKMPIEAANAYKLILETIKNASEAANAAKGSAYEAKRLSEGESDSALGEKVKSSALKSQAIDLQSQVEIKLELPLNTSISDLTNLEKRFNYSVVLHQKIELELEAFADKLKEVGAKSENAVETARVADERAKEKAEKINSLSERVQEAYRKARSVPDEHYEVKSAIQTANSYAERVSQIVPNISNLIEKVSLKSEKLQITFDDISLKTEELRKKIAFARGEANRIDLGMEFFSDSYLQLRNPENLENSGSYLNASVYFKTLSPAGLLFYIGNPVKVKRETTDSKIEESMISSKNDYLTLEIENGRPKLTVDCGAGKQIVVCDVFVATGEWHQIVVEKIGDRARIKVKDSTGKITTADGLIPGSPIFDLDNEHSKIYFGGVPQTDEVQEGVQRKHFVGYMEHLVINEVPIGFWNMVKLKHLTGATPRDKLPSLSMNGARFDGSSYIIFKGSPDLEESTSLSLYFKTRSEEGLLFLIDGQSQYFASFLKRGTISLVFQNGPRYEIVTSSKLFNDGMWHYVQADRSAKEGEMVLRVDRQEIGSSPKFASGIKFSVREIFLGGYPKEHSYGPVTNFDFYGCIKEVQIGNLIQDFHKSSGASPGVVFGCPDLVIREAVFNARDESFIAMDLSAVISKNVNFVLKFKTKNPNGLLIFASNEDRSSYVALYLESGSVVVRVQPGGEIRTSSVMTYSDDKWHYVVAKKAQQLLSLTIDDQEPLNSPTSENDFETTEQIYFGGVPRELYPKLASLNIPSTFTGCIGDIVANDNFQNFAESRKTSGVALVGCVPSNASDILPLTTPTIKTPPSVVTDKHESPEVSSEPTPSTSTSTESSPVGNCKLPLTPHKDIQVGFEDGIRFGMKPYSRHEFAIPASVTSSLLDESSFGLTFKTDGPLSDGVLFYVTSSSNFDFVGLIMQNGKIMFSFNCGSGPAFIVSDNTYNDGKWHTAVFNIRGRNGILRITTDGEQRDQKFGHSAGDANSLNVKSPIYVGGLPESEVNIAKNKLKGVYQSFPGCIKDVHIQGEKYIFGIRSTGYQASYCSQKVEFGTFFYGNGYVAVSDEFRVGQRAAISLEIKPRNLNGLVMAVYGRIDYMILEMVDGEVRFSANNGAGPFKSVFKPGEKHQLCDGEWHKIEVYKESTMVTVNVDSTFAEPGWGIGGVFSTDTNSPLFIGGVPEDNNLPELASKPQFVGCIRNLKVNNKIQSIVDGRIYGNVSPNVCSTI
ncbi:Laminin subunit alpha-like protein [Dinothrombium tinctorium]|uniref:Laminin subunit alpha-like protein n=1 Tax=Dinothrombium tinctorium TaxID=1965070 RepID=A0A443RMR1_9ACAR|nr:Laminin subunit alpha-like protein [Dinothrombium tinctorium]RWS16541.1 Laminin subunit alpha-like protein [Dinothrombium tinctorium]